MEREEGAPADSPPDKRRTRVADRDPGTPPKRAGQGSTPWRPASEATLRRITTISFVSNWVRCQYGTVTGRNPVAACRPQKVRLLPPPPKLLQQARPIPRRRSRGCTIENRIGRPRDPATAGSPRGARQSARSILGSVVLTANTPSSYLVESECKSQRTHQERRRSSTGRAAAF